MLWSYCNFEFRYKSLIEIWTGEYFRRRGREFSDLNTLEHTQDKNGSTGPAFLRQFFFAKITLGNLLIWKFMSEGSDE